MLGSQLRCTEKKKYYFFFSEGSVVNQVLCAVLINLPVFAYGASIGWMSPMTLLLQSKDTPTEHPLTDTEVSWMAAIAYIVCIFSDFLVAYLGDKIGRKITLLMVSVCCAGCWISLLCSVKTWAFIFSRSMVGVAMAGSYVVCPLYTKEISQDSIRGFLGSFVIFFHTTGNLFIYIIGDYLSFRMILMVCLSIPLVHIFLFIMMPESPSYLVKKGRKEEAKRAIAWLRCTEVDDKVVTQEIDAIEKEQEIDGESSKFPIKALLKDKTMFKAFRIAMLITLTRDVCGVIPVLNFAGDIFSMSSKGSGLVLTPNQQAMMLGAVQVTGAMLASSVVEKAGRKMLFIVNSTISGLSMCALASWFLAKHYDVITPAWLPIIALCVCIFCDSAGLCPISVVITTEMFSFKFRGAVIATTMSTSCIADFIQLLFFKPLAKAIGVYVPFYFFGCVCLLSATYIGINAPETKNKTLAQIYEDLERKNKKDKNTEMELT